MSPINPVRILVDALPEDRLRDMVVALLSVQITLPATAPAEPAAKPRRTRRGALGLDVGERIAALYTLPCLTHATP